VTTRRRFLTRSLAAGSALAIGIPTRANPGADARRDTEYVDFLNPETLRTIDRGLAYLANTQNRDGSFGENFNFRGNLAVTGLAGLALMAGGHTPNRGTYGAHVMRALEFILSKERRDPPGFFFNESGDQRQGKMYSHGFATLFLCEVFGMVPDRALQNRLKGAIERAVQVIINSQNSEGGWRYEPVKSMADSSVTICQIMALRAAKNVGFHVPKEVADKCVKYIRSCQTADGGFSYFAGQGPAEFARSAAGVVALYCAGVYSGPEVERGLRYLMRFKPGEFAPGGNGGFGPGGAGAPGGAPGGVGRGFFPNAYYFYGQYYAAQAMWTAGPKYWDVWFPAIRDELLRLNRGQNNGSWVDPSVCNHYATAMSCIILQIPNNYLPILQK
jgi:Prenyltransferase and squalene oxidase repeat